MHIDWGWLQHGVVGEGQRAVNDAFRDGMLLAGACPERSVGPSRVVAVAAARGRTPVPVAGWGPSR